MKKFFSVRFLFIAAIIALCTFSFLSYKRMELLMRSSRMVTHTTEVKLELQKLISAFKDAEAGHRGYLLTHDKRFLESFETTLKEYRAHINSLKQLVADNASEQQNLSQVQALATRRVDYMFTMLEIDRIHSPTAEQMLGGKKIMDSLQNAINKMADVENRLLNVRNAELARQSVITPVWLLFFTFTSLAILIITFLAITKQIRARRKTEASQKELQQIFRQAPVTIVVYAGKDLIVEVANNFALEMWGKKEEDVIGKPFFEISPELREKQEPLLRQILQTGNAFIGKEFRAQYTRGGQSHSGYFDFVYQPRYNDAKEITGIIAIGTEVTHSVIARKKIEESEEKFRTLATEAPLFVWLTDENLQTTFLNKNGLGYFNLAPPIDFAQLSWKKFIHPDDLDRVLYIMKEAAQIHKSYTLEMRLKNGATGAYRWFLDKGAPRFENEKFIGFIGTTFDIHDLKLSQEKLRQSEERYRLLSQTLEETVQQRTRELRERNVFTQTLLDSSVDLIFVVDKDLRYMSLNKKAREALQLIYPGEVTGCKIDEVTPGVQQHPAFADLMQAFAGNVVHRSEYRSSVGGRFFDLNYVPIRNEKEIYAVMTLMRDVTENVRTKQEIEKVNQHLQQRNEFIETIIDASQEMIAVWDKDLRLLTVNKTIEQLLGADKEQLTGKGLFELYPNAKESKPHSDLLQALAGETVKNEPFYSSITDKYVQNYITPLKDNDGNIYAALAIAHDVTDIKKAEEELKKSQQHFSQLFNVSPVAMSLSHLDDGEVVNVNEAWEKMFQFNRQEVIGKNASELKLADPIQRTEKLNRIKHNGGSAHGMEMKYHLPNGKVIYAFVSVESVELDGVPCLLAAYFDISERKLAEEKIKKANQLLEDKNAEFLEAQRLAHIGSWEWNIAENKISWTDELYRIFGVSPDNFESTFENYIALLHPDDRELATNTVERAYQTHEPFDFMHRTIRHDGSTRILHGRGEVVLNEKQEPIRMLGTAQDVTELKQYEAEIEKKNTELENMNKELSSFAYVASHDLQEPLRKIQVLSKRILEKEISGLSADGRECFRRMENAANRMQQLINDLLSYSRTAVRETHLEPTDLNNLLQQVKMDLNEKLTTTSATIETGRLPELNVVPFQFKQLFTNLINNSIKFSRPGVAPHIKIESSITNKLNGAVDAQKKYYHIRITDNGIGFENEYKDQIFGLFSRLHGRAEYEGTGIGLSICKRIIENHNGTIDAEGEPGKGATFNIYLPVER
ncbi:MAG TPA: PAS domain S-box protein [Parafilimonas sp.]|nr:PAS domain S-box protein [Parafilimonas sp.]